MTYEIQHRTQHPWETEARWGLTVWHPTLSRCVLGCARIIRQFPGQSPLTADEFRIVAFNANGYVVGIFNAYGSKIGGAPEYGNGPDYRDPATPGHARVVVAKTLKAKMKPKPFKVLANA